MLFESYIKLKRPATKKACITAIKDLESYLGRTASSCTIDEAIDYLATYRNGGRSDATVLHRYHILRGYFEFLIAARQVDHNPFRVIPSLMSLRQKRQVRPTRTLDIEQVKAIIAGIEDSRHRAFVAALFGAGLRRSEALAIRPCNLILAPIGRQSYLELRETKAGQVQLQPIPSWLAEMFRPLLLNRRATDRLFDWSDKTAYRIFRNACLAQGINAAPHSFRAAAATYLKEQGEEDRSVADFLRHKTTQMVAVYDHRARKAKAKTKQCLEDFFAETKKTR